LIESGRNIPIINFFRWIRRKSRSIFRQFHQKYIVFIFFIGLSTLAWYMRALSDTYVADIDYPVKYTNLPPNRMLSQEPLKQLKLRVQADGYTILSSRFKYKRPLSYNVNAFALYSLTEDSTSVYTLTSYAREKLSAELGLSNKNIQILDINPDTLIFNFSRLKRKSVPIQVVLVQFPDLFKKQFMLNGIPFSIPSSIMVTGPSFIVDTLQKVYTRPLKLRNLSDTVIKKISLEPTSRLSYSLKKVKITVPVDEFTEVSYDIPIEFKGVPDSLIGKTFPKSVRLKYITTLSHFNDVGPDSFHVYVDYIKIESGLSPKLKVEMDSVPSFLHKVSITPRTVEFLIERKNAKSWSDRRNR
jgi:hypothetical protein